MVALLLEALNFSLDVIVKIYSFVFDYILYIILGVVLIQFVRRHIDNFIYLYHVTFSSYRYREIRPTTDCPYEDQGGMILYEDLKMLPGKKLLINAIMKDEDGGFMKYDTIVLDRRGIHLLEIIDYPSRNFYEGKLSDKVWLRECEGNTWYEHNPAIDIKAKEVAFREMYPEYSKKNIYCHIALAEDCSHSGELDIPNMFVYSYPQAYHFFKQIDREQPKVMKEKEVREMYRTLVRKAKRDRKEYLKSIRAAGLEYGEFKYRRPDSTELQLEG